MDSSPGQVNEPNSIGDGGSVMVTMLASSVVDHGFEFWSGQRTKLHRGGGSVVISMRALSVVDYTIGDYFCHLIELHNLEFTYLKMFQ